MKFFTFKASIALSMCSALLVAACGGGGGGGSDNGPQYAPSAITAANAVTVSAQMGAASSAYGDQSNFGSSFGEMATGVSVSGGGSGGGLLKASLRQLYKGLETRPAGDMVTGVTKSATTACSEGGSISVTATYASAGVVSNGDSVSINANNCVEGTEKINGGLSFTFSNVVGTPDPIAPWSATMSMTYTNFTDDLSGYVLFANGDMTLAFSQSSSDVASASARSDSLRVSLSENGKNVGDYTFTNAVYSGTLDGSTHSYSADYAVRGLIGNLGYTSFSVRTTKPFKGNDGAYPYEGSMTITASNNSTATLTAVDSTNVRIDLDKNADGAIDETINTTWADLHSRI